MKIAVIIVRVLLGLLYVMGAVTYFVPQLGPKDPQMNEAMKAFMAGIMAAGYLMPLAKVFELVCGLALVIGRFVPLATVVIFPITLNIFLINLVIDSKGAPIGIAMLAANLFLAWAHREKYKPMLVAK